MIRFGMLRNYPFAGLVLGLACLGVGGCGQTGALYLPEQHASESPGAEPQENEAESASQQPTDR